MSTLHLLEHFWHLAKNLKSVLKFLLSMFSLTCTLNEQVILLRWFSNTQDLRGFCQVIGQKKRRKIYLYPRVHIICATAVNYTYGWTSTKLGKMPLTLWSVVYWQSSYPVIYIHKCGKKYRAVDFVKEDISHCAY